MKANKCKNITVKDDGTIIAKYLAVPNVYWDLAEHSQNDCLNDIIGVIDREYHIERRFDRTCNRHSASAVCNDSDTYSEKKGTQIAKTKSDWKFHNNMKRRYRQYYKHLCKILDEVYELENFHDRKCKHIERYLEDI